MCLPVCLSACLPVCLSVCLSACLPVCLSVAKEELDTSGEWFFDPKESTLSFWPNTTDGSAGKEVVAPLLSAIVHIEGAKDVTFAGFRFTETRSTFLDQSLLRAVHRCIFAHTYLHIYMCMYLYTHTLVR
eukprot:COSAG03_NODE_6796_length_1004_cov_5.861878_2_plen_130_part_00